MITNRAFYRRNAGNESENRLPWIAPEDCEDSYIDLDTRDYNEDDDDDVLDPDYNSIDTEEEDDINSPSTSTARVRKGGRKKPVVPHELPVEDEENDPPNKRGRVELVWKKEDVQRPPLPEYVHPMPDLVREPFEYFLNFFTEDVISHIVYQTNLYARQKNLCSNFVLDDKELMVLIGLVIFMGVTSLPSIVDYWKRMTRIPQVADIMSKNRFKQIRATLHFNDNHQCEGSQDRFYKIRPLFTKVTKEFLKVRATPINSIDEVMVAYKGTRAGNLRQYIANKPDKWGYKLFCRSSVDGFVHDILMYQGATTFETHPIPLGKDEKEMNISAKVVVALVRTLKDPKNSAVYADNYFTSLSLAKHLRSHYGCRYVGTARENRIGHPPLWLVK
ncbi:hypothetical protein Pcinc_007541 [Petrolisthes cinctipes]|uniref:PiggyBac transposable element-derived protein domain-containing protein n=1 Tax=Petrolisthes cinctipes TaxID=88211 RepID=A0AAE1KY34_PETCI|nr:hypothetical protein Pcinc_007541 [Petrolisthes cinctipes]